MAGRTIWILVSDASRARLFADTSAARPYALVATFDHPESRARVADLVSDTNGRKPVGGSRGVNARPGGFHGRPGVEPDTDPKDVEAIKFARDLSDALSKGLDDRGYDELIVAAPPRFLGMLRETVSEQVRRRMVREIDKDLSLLPPREIEKRIRAASEA
jgi:protein required for attachment to host cells